jgi:hypothetical protein
MLIGKLYTYMCACIVHEKKQKERKRRREERVDRYLKSNHPESINIFSTEFFSISEKCSQANRQVLHLSNQWCSFHSEVSEH